MKSYHITSNIYPKNCLQQFYLNKIIHFVELTTKTVKFFTHNPLFIALKQKMIKTMIAMNMPLVGEPSTDNFGTKETETRISFSSTFKVKSKKFKIKVKVHSTKCSMDFQGCGNNSDKKHEELNNKTVAKYFVEEVLPYVIDNVKDEVNIEYLNYQYRELARCGLESLQTDKELNCEHCKKICDKDKDFKCTSCRTSVHLNCLPKKMDKNALAVRGKCDKCIINPTRTNNDKLMQTTIEVGITHESEFRDEVTTQFVSTPEKTSVVENEENDSVATNSIESPNEKEDPNPSHYLSDIDERIKRMQSELHHEKQQNEDRKDIIKEALEQNKNDKDKIFELEKRINILTAENELLKSSKASPDDQDNQRLREIIIEAEKESMKLKEKMEKEIMRLKNEKLEALEKLRCAVLDKERLKETERVLLNTFDMMKKFVDQKTENCDKCEFSTSNPEEFKTHECNNHNNVKINCIKCEFESDDEDKLSEHMRVKHGSETNCQLDHTCVKCDFAANSRKLLEKHVKEKHEHEKQADKYSNQTYGCNKCDFESDAKDQLSEHMANKHSTATQMQKYICDKCDFAATSNEVVKKHIKEKHECTTIYLCEHCEFECKLKGDLKKHLLSEHSTNPKIKSKHGNVFECCQCKKCFVTFDQLVAHTETSHKLIVYNCNVCDYQTNLEDNLKEHNTLVHSSINKKDIGMGPTPSKKPCKFDDPLHSTTCCDRQSGYKNVRLISRKEKQDNGYCRFWNNGYCRMGDICKYLHEESPECFYQDQCRDNKCVYFHSKPFLAPGFFFHGPDFPPLPLSPRRRY